MRAIDYSREGILVGHRQSTLEHALNGEIGLSFREFKSYLQESSPGYRIDTFLQTHFGGKTLDEAWKDHLAEQYQRIPCIGLQKTAEKLENAVNYFAQEKQEEQGPKIKEAVEEAISFAESPAAELDSYSRGILGVLYQFRDIETQKRSSIAALKSDITQECVNRSAERRELRRLSGLEILSDVSTLEKRLWNRGWT